MLQQEHLKAIKHMIIHIAQQGLTCIMSSFNSKMLSISYITYYC